MESFGPAGCGSAATTLLCVTRPANNVVRPTRDTKRPDAPPTFQAKRPPGLRLITQTTCLPRMRTCT
jgi:hypothetical protein